MHKASLVGYKKNIEKLFLASSHRLDEKLGIIWAKSIREKNMKFM